MKPSILRGIALLGFLLVLGAEAYAQAPPDAGALQQQMERQLPKALPEQKKQVPVFPPAYKAAPGLTVTVKAFRFAGNLLMSAEQLAPAVADYLNRPIDFNTLQKATVAVAEAYRANGWLVRVYLPKQDIQDGIVTLQIVEGIFGKVRIEDPMPQRISVELAHDYIASAQQPGKPLNTAALDRALLLLDDLPGVAVSSNLAAGSEQSETDIVLKLPDEPLLTGDAGIDNTGSRSTGQGQLTANAYLNSPLKIGDQASANVIHAEGSDYMRLAYAAPVGNDGLRLGINASSLDYKVITPEFKAADIKGNSYTWGLNAQYPLIRSRNQNLYVSAALDDKRFDNQAGSATTTKYGIRNLSFGLSGNVFDKLGGGGSNMASFLLTVGKLDLDGSPNQAADALTTRAEGNFTKLRYALSRQQALTADLSVYALLTGQFANKNLDSAEKFYLGGANGVRAYPTSEGGGSEGAMLNLELRYRMMPNLVLIGFYDWGSVRINKDNDFNRPPTLNSYELDGFGAAVAWTGPAGLTLKATYAHRVGDNPNHDASTGNDQDGSLVKDRFWLTLSLPFGYSGSNGNKGAPVSIPPAPTPVATAPSVTPTTPPNIEETSSRDSLNRDQLLIADGLRFDSALLTKGNKTLLDDFIVTDSSAPDNAILVIGHTDSTGSRPYNQLLSQKRANSARHYLVKKGIERKRIATRGDGEDAPVASNATKEGRAKNRRIEIKVTSRVTGQEN